MSDHKQTEQKPDLKALVDRYQKTHAPPGFAERVAAHVRTETESHSPLAGHWVYAASITFVLVLAVSLVTVLFEEDPATQLAGTPSPVQEASPARQTTPEPEQKKSIVNTEAGQQDSPPVGKSAEQETQMAHVTETVKEESLEEKPIDDGSFANVAVLSEITDLLESDTALATPELTDMPALSEIEELFDTT